MSSELLPQLGVGEDSKSTAVCFSSVLLIDVRSANGLKNKSMMGKSSPYVEVSVPGATPPTCRTKPRKSTLDPEFNETMAFLLVPGTDSFNLKVNGLGSVTMMNKTMDDHLGEATGVKVTELLLPLQIEVPLDTQGAVKLSVQLLPLAETSFLPAALNATRAQLDLAVKQVDALQTQSNALLEAFAASSEEVGAAKVRAEQARVDAAELAEAMAAEKSRVAYLETQTASAKAAAALADAKARGEFFLANSQKIMSSALSSAAEAVNDLKGAMSGLKGSLLGAKSKDQEINGTGAASEVEGTAEDPPIAVPVTTATLEVEGDATGEACATIDKT